MSLPFFSGAASFKKQWPRLSTLLDEVVASGRFTNGLMVARFEDALAIYTGAAHAIAVGSGTDALILVLTAAGIGPGDEILVPPFTFFASASSIAHVGATPVFVDIDPVTYSMDPAEIEARITERTRAIMPVHLFTQMADMPQIRRLADKHRLLVLEDSAEAIGMWSNGLHAGLHGKAGVLSFFPTKTLGAMGDGGLILTDDADLARTCRLLRDQGRDVGQDPHLYHLAGFNSRMDDIQAAILLVKLQDLPRDIAHRAALAKYFDRRLQKLSPCVQIPRIAERGYATNAVYYVYLIEAERRDALAEHLAACGIGTEAYYPIPLHQQPCFAHLGYSTGDFPVAERACTRTLALPLYPDMSIDQADQVCEAIKQFYFGG